MSFKTVFVLILFHVSTNYYFFNLVSYFCTVNIDLNLILL
jgi:hypothetical protein